MQMQALGGVRRGLEDVNFVAVWGGGGVKWTTFRVLGVSTP